MSNKFSDYTNKNLDEFVEQNKQKLDSFKQNYAQQTNDINTMINRYSQMNQNEIFNEFLKVADEKKRNGTLTLEYINNIRSALFPYLTEEQKQTFNNLVNYIR